MIINLYIRPSCHTLLKAISILSRIAAVFYRRFRLFVLSRTLVSCRVVVCQGRKPYYSGHSFDIMKIFNRFSNTFLQTLPMMLGNQIERQLFVRLGPLSGIRSMIISASFQRLEKYSRLVQALNISQKKVFVLDVRSILPHYPVTSSLLVFPVLTS